MLKNKPSVAVVESMKKLLRLSDCTRRKNKLSIAYVAIEQFIFFILIALIALYLQHHAMNDHI